MYSTVIGNGRTLQEDDVICGYHIPKGVSILTFFLFVTILFVFIWLSYTKNLSVPIVSYWKDSLKRILTIILTIMYIL